jgi:hypothetical protein
MTRICIVGNSHVAALKLGWDKIAGDHPGIQVTFFGVPGRWLRALDLGEGTVTPKTAKHKRHFERLSGGMDTITVADYDLFVVVGLELSIFRWVNFYKDNRQLPFNLELGTPQILDAEVFDLCRGNIFRGTSGDVVYQGLKATGAGRVLVCPQPFPSPVVERRDAFFAQMMAVEGQDRVAEAYRTDMARAYDAENLLWQPEDTLAGPLLTDLAWSQGSVRINLNAPHGEEDYQHMNPAYGQRMLQLIMQAA